MVTRAAALGNVAPGRLAQRTGVPEILAHPVRTFHTVRHLQPRQIVYQALRRVQAHAVTDGWAREALVLLARKPAPQTRQSSGRFDGHAFCFLNRRIAWHGADRWHPTGADDLWIFNLHYFKYLASTSPELAQHLILDWIACNGDPRGAAWHPYPVSLRVREWIEWLHQHPNAPESLRASMIDSVVSQVISLSRRLEFNLMGNHLLENAITLCWAGLSFGGRLADAWVHDGDALLQREITHQVLADGSHEERSPMYQAQLAEAMLRLAEVAAQSPHPQAARLALLARGAGARMAAALEPLVHPDGEYALMNDTALGEAPTLASLVDRFAVAMPAHRGRSWSLRSGGFSGYRPDPASCFIFDAGPIGPDHQPGHGHAGALSFEVSAQGRRIVTDTGVLTYACGPARRHDRSTAAHNTIEIDGRDQSDVWGAFRCGRRAASAPVRADEGREGATFAGAYRGPGSRGPRAVAHERQVFAASRMLAFVDRVSAAGRHDAVLRVHLAPGLRAQRDGRVCTITDERRRPIATLASERFDWNESASPYHPEFGRELTRASISARLSFRDVLVARWWLLLN